VDKLSKILINRLEKKGIEPNMIYGFIRDLANTIGVNPSMNLLQVNKQLHLLGWDSVELDYHTLELATACFEAEGLESLENKPVC
jgi:hypothetical protein